MSWKDEIGVIITVHERPQLCRDLIASIRKHWGDVAVYVCDDSRDRTEYEGVTNVHPGAYDIGVSAKRNQLVEAATEPFLMLCEEDFVITEHSDLTLFYDALKALPKVGLAGAACCRGNPGNVMPKTGVKRTLFTGLSSLDGPWQTLEPPGKPETVNHHGRTIRYHYVHFVTNWFLARREALLAAPWDEDLKISGEHIEHMTRMQAVRELTEGVRPDNADQYQLRFRGDYGPEDEGDTTVVYAKAGFRNKKHFPNRRSHNVKRGERVRVPTDYAKALQRRGLAMPALNRGDALPMPVEAADGVPLRQILLPDTTCGHNREHTKTYRKQRYRDHIHLNKDKMGIFARRWTKGNWQTYPHPEPRWDEPSSHARKTPATPDE